VFLIHLLVPLHTAYHHDSLRHSFCAAPSLFKHADARATANPADTNRPPGLACTGRLLRCIGGEVRRAKMALTVMNNPSIHLHRLIPSTNILHSVALNSLAPPSNHISYKWNDFVILLDFRHKETAVSKPDKGTGRLYMDQNSLLCRYYTGNWHLARTLGVLHLGSPRSKYWASVKRY
jgi:hypothetical protein